MRAFDMLALQEVERGKTKCARYWPDQDATEEYGGFAVVNTSEETSKDYTLRQFLVSRKTEAGDQEQRKIFHFHFLGWPGNSGFLVSLCSLTSVFRSRHP